MKRTRRVGALVCIAAAAVTCAAPVSAESPGERLLEELKSAKERVCSTRPERLRSPAAGTVTGSTRLRAGPSTACKAKARVRKGIRLRVLGSHADWYYVSGKDSKRRTVRGWVERRKLGVAQATVRRGETERARTGTDRGTRTAPNSGPHADKATVRRVQAALNRRGYSAGTVDGVYGRNTRRALQSFQRDNGLSPSGRIDPRTLAALAAAPPATRQAASAASATSAAPPIPGLRNHCAELQRLPLPPGTGSPPCPFVYADDYVMECFVLPMKGQPVKASPLHDAPASERVIGALVPGEKFTAVARKDFVAPCPLQVKRATPAYFEVGPRGATRDLMLSPGEVVFQTSYLGEGTAAYWRNGQLIKGDNTGLTRATCQRWNCWAVPLMECREDELQRITSERWFHVQTRDGKSGWIREGEHLDWDEKC